MTRLFTWKRTAVVYVYSTGTKSTLITGKCAVPRCCDSVLRRVKTFRQSQCCFFDLLLLRDLSLFT